MNKLLLKLTFFIIFTYFIGFWELGSFSSIVDSTQNTTIKFQNIHAEIRRYVFISDNYENLESEMASAKGEYLSTLSSLYGCPQKVKKKFADMTQKNYDKLFPSDGKLTPHEINKILYEEIESDVDLKSYCKVHEYLNKNKKNIIYMEDIVYLEKTQYQKVIITKHKGDTRLYLNNHIQFSSKDEAIYHESLVHVPISLMTIHPKSVLVLGGGDGMAIREILKYPTVKNIKIVELDDRMISLFKNQKYLKELNNNALNSEKLEILIADAFNWLKDAPTGEKYDFIIADFPDPSSEVLGKLYSVSIYLNILNHLTENGILVTQSSSPKKTPKVFKCIQETILYSTRIKDKDSDWKLIPYQTHVPSFGDWGFILAGKNVLPLEERKKVNVPTTYLKEDFSELVYYKPPQLNKNQNLKINRLDNLIIVDFYKLPKKKSLLNLFLLNSNSKN